MVIEEAFLFSDDSAFVKFEDGSSLQLSSCGAVFRCSTDLNSVANKHVLNKRETQQFCQFTTTLWKERVKFSLGFRNKFAEIPYVCRHLLGMDVLEKKTLVTPVCTWPGTNTKQSITEHEDGSLTVASLEGIAAITLSACRQTVTAKFLCQVPSEQLDNPEKLVYSWVEQVFSINSSHPRYIQYPLNVLLGGSMTPDEEYSSCMAVELPRSLPLHCKKAHMHKWRKQSIFEEIDGSEFMEKESLKVLYSEGVVYRFYYEKYFIAEAIPSDSSVIRSEGPSQLYFKHWIYDFEKKKVMQNVYSMKALPLDKKDQPYSISMILKTLIRYLNYLSYRGNGRRSFKCCWKDEDDPLSIPSLPCSELESSIYVHGLGSFKTYTNGRIRIVFCDGSIMDLIQPVQRQYGKDNAAVTLLDSNPVFNLILPNGTWCKSYLYQPGLYERYARAALEFVEWRRRQVDRAINLDEEKISSIVAAELDKLKRFNSQSKSEIQQSVKPRDPRLGNTINSDAQNVNCDGRLMANCKTRESSLKLWDANMKNFPTTHSHMENMHSYLKDTRRTVDEIESVLKNCRSQLTKF